MNIIKDERKYNIYLGQSVYGRYFNTKYRFLSSYYVQNCLYDFLFNYIKKVYCCLFRGS